MIIQQNDNIDFIVQRDGINDVIMNLSSFQMKKLNIMQNVISQPDDT
jgi:hypothetical protein